MTHSIRNGWHYLIGKVKAFFLSMDALTFLLFFALSTAFWFVHTLNRTRETVISVPISYSGLSDDVYIDGELPATINVTIKDEGKNLFAYGKKGIRPIQFDLSAANSGKLGNIRISNAQLLAKITPMLSSTTKLIGIAPENITVNYIRQMRKTVPVVFVGSLEAAQQYTLTQAASISPTTVNVYGSASIIDTLKAIYTDQTIFKDLVDTLRTNVALHIPAGLRVVPANVQITAIAEMFTEKTLTLPIVARNLPEHISVRTFPAEVEVTFNISMSQFNSVQASDIEVIFDYKALQQTNDTKAPLQVQTKIPGISNIRITPNEVDYILMN